MRRDERYEAGLQARREVLGDEYVERALAGADDFTAELQEFLNSNCWGYAWTREGIDRRTRSLVTLAGPWACPSPASRSGCWTIGEAKPAPGRWGG